ncbi:galactose-3-O-sulfotransferase 3-like [Actinia tenebrosa]|uniref:Galactose-3-O-sulfotransferase 3-like n=1 Tax=Actinia tenebrosa TaxID=6105 RepID=A0A6P8IBC9_ACTTE|nr:galactose-3-O-sulfotransferase 3-like [Actinia tenebrosa]
MMSILLNTTNKRRVLLLFLLVLFCAVTMLIQFYLVNKSRHPREIFFKTGLLSNHLQVQCTRPVKDIMFLKTHKTGSSTLTNIMNRYADSRELNVVIPAQDEVYTFYWPYKFQLNFIAPLNNFPNILCNHARFNKIPMNILLPKTRAKYITLLREPVSNYESVFYFFNLDGVLRLKKESRTTMGRFLSRNISLVKLRELIKKSFYTASALARNPQSFDLGLEMEYYENITAVKNYIDFLDSEFDLVLILEHFDESLVLMKRLFCWDLKDILYVKQMERLKIERNKEVITDDLKSKIRRWNKADDMLYSHFNATLWKRIHSEGPDFYEDLEIFRSELKQLQDVCLEKGSRKTLAYRKKYVRGYQVKANVTKALKNYCQKFVLNEVDYSKYHREKLKKQSKA